MPTKLGKGGAGPEDFDPDTGEYVAGSSISKRGDKYWVHGDLRSRMITKDEYDAYKAAGYKEDFDNDKIEIYDDLNSKSKNMPSYIKEILNQKETYNTDVENGIKKAIDKIKLIKFSDSGDSGFSRFYNEITFDLSGLIGIESATIHDYNTIGHELGHKIDAMIPGTGYWNSWYSSHYISLKYGKTMYEMIQEELREKPVSYYQKQFCEEFKQLYAGKIKECQEKQSYNGFSDFHYQLLNKYSDILDTLRATFLNEIHIPNNSGCHSTKYFNDYDRKENVGTELFAEITGALFQEKNSNYITFLKQHAPKTLDIYFEIMKEVSK